MTDCPMCEYHKDRAARRRAEAYKQAGHDVIELPWVGLTNEEFKKLIDDAGFTRSDLLMVGACVEQIVELVQAKLKEKNSA